MNSNFGILPPGKSGNSVRLKTKNIRDVRMETLQLEMQNEEMEQKLNQLRLNMSKEKGERERSNGYHWKSGQSRNPPQNNKESTVRVCSGKVKLKVLKNPISEPEKLKTYSKPVNMQLTEKVKSKGKPCGQCESKSALLMCLECGEDYCAACFANIHQKGALKLHRTMPMKGKSQDGKLDGSHAFRKELNADESSRKLERNKYFTRRIVSPGVSSFDMKGQVTREAFISESRKQHNVPDTAGSLLHGSFNEEKSAKYFNEALLEWRNQAHCNAQLISTADRGTDSADNSAVQAILTVLGKSLEVEFKESGLSYLEKLMLKKHRRTPVNQFTSKPIDKVINSPTNFEIELDECNDLTAEEMDAHEYYVALFRAEEHVRNDVMHELALKIVELDKEPEGGLEETTHFLVTAVETNEIRNHSESLSGAQNQRQQLVPQKVPKKSPICSGEKQSRIPQRSTYCIYKEEPLKISQDKFVFKASHLEDSKSMKYKSFQDNQSLDPALMVNMPQEFQSIVLREKNQTSEYKGLKGFFTLETGHEQGCFDLHYPPTTDLTNDKVDADNKITFIGTPTGRSFSTYSLYKICRPLNTSRPNTARERPMSRAASEISEIESVDLTDGHDHVFEDENESETLTFLEKELYALNLDDMSSQLSISNDEQFQLCKPSKILTSVEDNSSLKRSQMHILESCSGETVSDDEETLQDKLNVLSLQ